MPRTGAADRSAGQRSARPTTGSPTSSTADYAAGGDGHHRHRCGVRRDGSGWPTSATAGPTCCATVAWSGSPTTTAGCSRWSTTARSARPKPPYHPHRSLLLKVLNGQPANDPDLTAGQLRPATGCCSAATACAAWSTTRDRGGAARCRPGGGRRASWSWRRPGRGRDRQHHRDPGRRRRRRRHRYGPVVLGAAAERDIPDRPTVRDGSGRRPRTTTTTRRPERPGTAVPASRRRVPLHPAARPDRRRCVRSLLGRLAVLLVAARRARRRLRLDPHPVLRRRRRRPGGHLPGSARRHPGVPLSQVYEVQPLAVAALPPYYQAQVTAGIEVRRAWTPRPPATRGRAGQAAAPSAAPPSADADAHPDHHRPTASPRRTAERDRTATASATAVDARRRRRTAPTPTRARSAEP